MNSTIFRHLFIGLAISGLASGSVYASSVNVIGGLSNFDVYNTTGQNQNEFQVELPGIKSSDLNSYNPFWNNTHYYKGHDYTPSSFMAASSDGIAGHTSLFVDYKNPTYSSSGHLGFSAPGEVDHFGVHLNYSAFNVSSPIYSWKSNGTTVSANLPDIKYATTQTATGGVTIRPTVVNTTNTDLIVRLSAAAVTPTTTTTDGLQLSNLTTDNPEITALEHEAEVEQEVEGHTLLGVLLRPGQVLGVDGEAHDPLDDVILHPDAWLAANTGQNHSHDVNIENAGASDVVAVSVFEAATDSNNNVVLGNNIANVFQAVNTSSTTPVPEPSIAWLLVSGLASLGVFGKRKKTV